MVDHRRPSMDDSAAPLSRAVGDVESLSDGKGGRAAGRAERATEEGRQSGGRESGEGRIKYNTKDRNEKRPLLMLLFLLPLLLRTTSKNTNVNVTPTTRAENNANRCKVESQ